MIADQPAKRRRQTGRAHGQACGEAAAGARLWTTSGPVRPERRRQRERPDQPVAHRRRTPRARPRPDGSPARRPPPRSRARSRGSADRHAPAAVTPTSTRHTSASSTPSTTPPISISVGTGSEPTSGGSGGVHLQVGQDRQRRRASPRRRAPPGSAATAAPAPARPTTGSCATPRSVPASAPSSRSARSASRDDRRRADRRAPTDGSGPSDTSSASARTSASTRALLHLASPPAPTSRPARDRCLPAAPRSRFEPLERIGPEHREDQGHRPPGRPLGAEPGRLLRGRDDGRARRRRRRTRPRALPPVLAVRLRGLGGPGLLLEPARQRPSRRPRPGPWRTSWRPPA